MKISVFFRRWNSINFRPPLNRHVPVAWLPKEDGFQWLRRPGIPGKTVDVIFSSQSPHMANFAYYFSHFGHFDAELLSFFQWWEVAVSYRIVAMAQIERQESPCMLVQRTKTPEIRGSVSWERSERIFTPVRRLDSSFAPCTSRKAVSLGLSTQVSEGKSNLDPFLPYGKRGRELKFTKQREVNVWRRRNDRR